MVCDKIFGGKYLSGAGLTLIGVGGSHPEDIFKNKKVCITRQIIDYNDKPEIMIPDPEQIKEDK